jgi:hypothetical protein
VHATRFSPGGHRDLGCGSKSQNQSDLLPRLGFVVGAGIFPVAGVCSLTHPRKTSSDAPLNQFKVVFSLMLSSKEDLI